MAEDEAGCTPQPLKLPPHTFPSLAAICSSGVTARDPTLPMRSSSWMTGAETSRSGEGTGGGLH